MKTAKAIIDAATDELTRLTDWLRQHRPQCRQVTVAHNVLDMLKKNVGTATLRGYHFDGERVMYREFEVKAP